MAGWICNLTSRLYIIFHTAHLPIRNSIMRISISFLGRHLASLPGGDTAVERRGVGLGEELIMPERSPRTPGEGGVTEAMELVEKGKGWPTRRSLLGGQGQESLRCARQVSSGEIKRESRVTLGSGLHKHRTRDKERGNRVEEG